MLGGDSYNGFTLNFDSSSSSVSSQQKHYGLTLRCIRNETSVGPNKPTVTTCTLSNLTFNSALCGGEIINDGGSAVTSRGVCWNTNKTPIISETHTSDGTGDGPFVSNLSGLGANTTIMSGLMQQIVLEHPTGMN